MLTRLRVQGFKNLLDVDVRFGPFTCIAGKNAVGKSNLFDAIRFFALLTQHPIMEAVKLLRESKGRSPEPRSLFTAFGDYISPEMRFTAELIVDRYVQDDFGVTAQAATSALRYDLAFRLVSEDGLERLELSEESLVPIPQEVARRSLGFPAKRTFRESIKGRRPNSSPFISTSLGEAGSQIKVHQEGHGGRKVSAPKSSRTIVGGTASSDFPTILAVHREMEAWRTLLLEPSAMRAPSFYSDPRVVDSRGGNLAAAIERLRKEEEKPGQVFSSLANKLSQLIPDIHELRIKDDQRTETLTLEVKGRDGVFHPAGSLSDGTLRFLVLAALEADPAARGVICLEEPENGIHPERIPTMVRLLQDIAVDPMFPVDADNPLRQVVINTHSPVVIRHLDPNDVVYMDELKIVRQGSLGKVAHARVPRKTWRAGVSDGTLPLAPGQMRPYLGADPQDAQLWLDFLNN